MVVMIHRPDVYVTDVFRNKRAAIPIIMCSNLSRGGPGISNSERFGADLVRFCQLPFAFILSLLPFLV